MKGFVVLCVYRSTVKKQNKEKTLLCVSRVYSVTALLYLQLLLHVILLRPRNMFRIYYYYYYYY